MGRRMATAVSFPGVYIEEVPSSVRTIAGVATSVTAFVGFTARGPTNEAGADLQLRRFRAPVRRARRRQRPFLRGLAVLPERRRQAWIVRVAAGAPPRRSTCATTSAGGVSRADRHRTLRRAVGQHSASRRRLRQRQSGEPVQPHRLRGAGAQWAADGHALRDLPQPLDGQRLAGLCRRRRQRRLRTSSSSSARTAWPSVRRHREERVAHQRRPRQAGRQRPAAGDRARRRPRRRVRFPAGRGRRAGRRRLRRAHGRPRPAHPERRSGPSIRAIPAFANFTARRL